MPTRTGTTRRIRTKIMRIKDGRTHLAYDAEQAIDLDCGALVAITLRGADIGDTTTLDETVIARSNRWRPRSYRTGGRQGLSQQSDDERSARHSRPVPSSRSPSAAAGSGRMARAQRAV